jgi:hypothetical protein
MTRRRRGQRGGGPPRRAITGPNVAGLRVTSHEVQAASEGVVVTDGKVELRGRLFRHAEILGAMPLVTFAKISKSGVDSNSPDGMAAIYDLLKDCIYEGSGPDWDGCGRDDCVPCNDEPRRITQCPDYDAGDFEAFANHASRYKCQGDELMGVVKTVIESLARGRGASRSGSRSSSQPTSPSSTAYSSPRDTDGVQATSGVPEPPGGYIDVAEFAG